MITRLINLPFRNDIHPWPRAYKGSISAFSAKISCASVYRLQKKA